MSQFRGPALISAIVLVAFVWGYKKDAMHDALASRAPQPIEEAPVAPLATPPTVAAPSVYRPAVVPNMKPPVTTKQAAPAPAFTPPKNPYADLAQKYGRKSPSMAETFDAIRRDSVDQKQIIQKNAYFRKLSEQLKQLRGEDQPGATASPAGNRPSGTTAAGNQLRRPPRPQLEQDNPGGDTAQPSANQLPENQDSMELDEEQMDDPSEEEDLAEELDQLLEDAELDDEAP